MMYALIMAGGKGRRLWPMSRNKTPKQFISLLENKTFFELTCERLSGLIAPGRIYVATSHTDFKRVKDMHVGIPEDNIILEPKGKDTAPTIAYSVALISREDPDAIITVLPSDHMIRPAKIFQQSLKAASEIAMNSDSIIVFGVKPAYPSTSFGYIKKDGVHGITRKNKFYTVAGFTEKPRAATAAKYMKSGDYYWNSGMFVFKASTILNAFKKHQPKMFDDLKCVLDAVGREEQEKAAKKFFSSCDQISIDYAIMEKTDNIRMLEIDYFWDDLGSWESLPHFISKNKDRNVVIGTHFALDTKDSIIYSDNPKHLIATLGLKDIIVVSTKDVTLITTKEYAEKVKEVVEAMQDNSEYERFV